MFRTLTTTVLLTLAMGVASAGPMTLLEEAAEFEKLDVRVSDAGTGSFRLRPCDECDELQLKIAASTRLSVSGNSMPLKTLNMATLRSGTVFYQPKDGVVTRIEAAR